MALTSTQDEALRVLAGLLIKSSGPMGEAALLLVDAVRRGDAEEQRERTAELLALTR